MDDIRWERVGAGSGLLAVAFGVAGAIFERGAPGVGASPQQVADFVERYRTELLLQSLFMVLSVGALLWFLGVLRSYLVRLEGGTGRLSNLVFGAGLVAFGLQAAIQAPQSALAMAAGPDLEPQLAAMMSDLASAVAVVAYVPMAVMLTAVAVVSLRKHALPAWIAALSAVAAVTYVILTFGIAVDAGPFARGGAATFVPYALTVVWLAAVSIVIIVRLGGPPPVRVPDSPAELYHGPPTGH
jgi:hypothetical protein